VLFGDKLYCREWYDVSDDRSECSENVEFIRAKALTSIALATLNIIRQRVVSYNVTYHRVAYITK
jgi:hypothetical protein